MIAISIHILCSNQQGGPFTVRLTWSSAMLWGKGRGNITVHVIGNNLCCKRHSGLKPTSTRFRPAYLCPKESLTAVGCRKSYIFICLQGTAGGLVQDWGLQGTTVNVCGRISPKELGNLMEVEGCIVHRWRRGMNMLWARGPAKPRFALQPYCQQMSI